jgi:putative oxidoreductase
MSASPEYDDVSAPLAPRRAPAVVPAANFSKRYGQGDAQVNTSKERAVITTTARVTAREARPRRLTGVLLRVAQILLAAFFVFGAAVPKLTGSHQMVQEFGLIGAGQWFRYLVGTAELAGAIGLLTPWLAGLAAAGLAADMAGATIINATVLRNTTFGVNVWLTAILFAVFVLLAYGRRQQIKVLAAAIRR